MGELSLRSNGRLLRFNKEIVHTNDIDSFFKSFFRFFFNPLNNFNRQLMTCKRLSANIYPEIVITIRETLFKILDGFNISVSKDNNFSTT